MCIGAISTQLLLNLADFIYVAVDVNQKVALINRKGCEVFGYSEDEIIGKNWFDNFLPKRVRDETKVIFQKLLSGKLTQSESHESFILTKDGKERIIAWNNTFIRDEEGTITCTLSSGKDITKIRKTQKELKESEIRFRSIFNYSNDGYILRTVDGIILEANPRFLEIFGYESSEVISNDMKLFNLFETEEEYIGRKEEIDEKGFAQFEALAKRKDGTIFLMEVNAVKLLLTDEEVIFGIVRDITERKKDEEKIKSSEVLYKALFDNTGTAMMLTEEDFTIALVNKLFLKKSGLSQDELLGKKWTDFIQKAEEELKTSEERLRTLFENIPLAISTNSSDGELIDTNPAFWNLYGYNNKDECHSIPSTNRWFNIKDRERFYDSLRQRNFIQNFEAKQYRKDGSEFWVSITAGAQPDTSGEKKYFNALRDITIEKLKEDELRRQTLRYHLKESQLYLIEEDRPFISKEAFSDLLRVGYNGLVLSRLPETEWKRDINYEFDFLRLAEKGHLKTISSDLSKIEQLIEQLPNKHVIVIDRLDYLISKNGFETTLFFIFRLMDIVYLSNHIIIVSLDPATIDEKERKSLRKEMRMIESVVEASLPEELIEILDFVHRRNITGDKPSYTDIVETFRISRPTARKRIKDLISEEFIFELKKGRSKVLGITTKGKVVFD